MILRLAVLVEHELVTDRHTTTAYIMLAWRQAVKINQLLTKFHLSSKHKNSSVKLVPPRFSSTICSGKEPMEIIGTAFYGPDALYVA